jgi:hypothetical protein
MVGKEVTMKKRHAMSGLMVICIAAGCGDATLGDIDHRAQAIGACNPINSGHDCLHLNGAGVYVASSASTNDFGLRDGHAQWLLTGFTNASTAIVANGWYEASGAPVPADGQVTGARYRGQSYDVQALSVTGTEVTVLLEDGTGRAFPVAGVALQDLTLQLQVPAPSLTEVLRFVLRFADRQTLPGYVADLTGYSLFYRRDPAGDGDGIGSWSSHCQTSEGQTMPSIFSQGAHWNPASAARTLGSERVTVSCESGAIATCMLWGYRPWATAQRQDDGQPESLTDYHQACIHMKRAAYCGDGASYTTKGTEILMADPFDPASTRISMDPIEAFWGPDGALCLSTPRHPSVHFQGCPDPLPSCSVNPPAGWMIVSGTTHSGGDNGKLKGAKKLK